MKEMHKYELEFARSYRYFIYSLYEINKVSSVLLDTIDFRKGKFFTLLPDDANLESVYQFQWGGVCSSNIEEYAKFILEYIKLNKCEFSCIFDSFNDDWNEVNTDAWCVTYGYHYENEVFYVLRKAELTEKLILECMRISNVNWHSMCVISEANFNDLNGKNISEEKINEISEKTKLIMIGAYDAEGYVFWERI